MKKITLLLLTLFFSLAGYSQFTPVTVEGFENTTGPDVGPSTNWTLATGNWAVFDNGVGTGQRWGINSSIAVPPIVHAGANAAYVNRENIGQGNTSEDFLATPLVNIPANGELHFYTRMFTNNNQGTLYQIRVAPASAVQTNPAAYTTVTGGSWTEVDLLTGAFNIYEEKVVNLSAYAGTQVYIAFVKVYTQPSTTLDGDRWLVDDVSVLEKCLDPTALTAGGITQTTADLSWGNPSGATSWEIEVLPFASTPTGTGVVYNGFLPYTASATATGTPFTPNTNYKYYVRALCSNGANSTWIGPFAFSTTSPGFSCAAPIVITTLPYNTTDNTSNYGDAAPLEGTPGAAATCGSGNAYLGGNDVVYSYTAATSGVINVTMTPTGTFSGIFAYASCADIGVNCLAGVANGNTNVRTFDLPVVAGSTYYFVISTWPAPQTTAYTLTIQVVNCPPPTTLAVTGLTQNSVNLTWANPGGATSWQYDLDVAAAPIPAGAGTTTGSNTINPEGGLATNTAYRFYVRADCGNGTFSAWAGPFVFNTLCDAFPVPFWEGFNTTSPTENCWTVLNSNGDGDQWNMNYATTPFEGDQCAAITTDFNGGANNDWLISPQIILTGNQRLKFHYRVQSTGEPDAFRVMLSTNGPSPADFTTTLVPLTTYGNTTYVQTVVPMVGVTGPVNIGWHVPQGGPDGWRIFIDNVIIEDIPTCPEPASITSSNVLAHEATITWTTGGGSPSQWQIIALPCGSPPPGASPTETIYTVDANTPYTLTDLTASTCYDVYVRAVCPGNDISPWTGPTTFTTQVEPPVCGGTYTDPGGPTANYANGEDSTVTICPPPGQVVTVTFTSFNTETNWDALYVFDGNSINAPQIASANGAGNVPGGLAGGYWGTAIPGPFTSSDITGCLTFRFRSDGSVNNPGWIANVTCGPAPNCPKPTALTATQITTTSAMLGWNEPTPGVTSWDIIIVPLGDPVPLPDDPDFFTVYSNPTTITGLNPGTQYTFYVRTNCPIGGESALSTGFNFNTLLANDDCAGAIFAPVNGSAVCQQVTPGSIAGATASASPAIAPCIGTADDDVWFHFIATNPYLNVALQNVVGNSTNLNFAVYSGQCGTLTQVFCSAANSLAGVLNNLTVGNTYYIRVYSNDATAHNTTFNLCISTPSTCPTAATVCSLTNYANTTGVTSLGTIGCLFTSPNPAYFTIQVATSGPINFLLTQSTTPGGAPNIDVDYAAWGPFTSQEAACTFIGSSQPFAAPGIGVPVTQQTGCSYSAAPTENLNIANAQAGQFYIVLITNFSNQAGFINLTQSNQGQAGAGTTLCCPDANFSYTPTVYCKSPTTPNPIPVIAQSSVAGVFSSTITPGLVFANTATGEIDLQNSAAGNYIITNTVAATASCVEKVKSFTISIVEPTAATISYSAASYCQSAPLQNVTLTGTSGGTFSATPNGGLNINANTGTINPNSVPGVYTVIYSLPGSGVCAGSNPTAQVEIIASPVITQPAPVSVCNTYTLPALTVGNYFSQTGGVGPIDPSIPITTNQTIYIYADNNGCTDEKSFTVTINSAPQATVNVTQPTCAVQTGTIEVTSPVSTGSTLPANLFISEVTDATTGALTYIEIFNGTGAAVDLSNYKLRTFNNGSSTVTSSCDNTLSGMLNNNSTFVVAVGSATNAGGVVPNLSFTACTGVNTDDNIRLSTLANVDIDVWGRIDGVAFTPLNQPGYTYRRNNTATVPSTTWNAADWTAIDPEDYTNIGSYSLPASGYQYSLDNGTYESSTTFTGVTPGDHTITVLDLATGCYSTPITVTLTVVTQNPSVTTFTYPTTPICQNDATNPVPNTSAPGFTTGGTFSSTTGLAINPTTGVIDLVNSTAGTYVVTYAVLDNVATCTQAGSSTFTIVINPVVTPVTGFTYTTPICLNAAASILPTLATGFTTGGTFSSTTGLNINPSTGEITLGTGNAGSLPGTYTVTYIVPANPSATVCQIAGSSTFTIVINPVITPVTTISYTSPVCSDSGNLMPNTSATGFTSGGTYTASGAGTLTIDANTGEITVSTSTPGVYTVTYSVTADPATCRVASSSTAQVVITSPVVISVNGDCQGVEFVLTASPVDGSFDPSQVTYLWENSAGATIGTTQSVVVTALDTYTVTVTSGGCPNTGSIVVDAITCVIQKGISVNNDGYNDFFDLRGFNVKNLGIFNRYGVKVYSKGDYTDQWKGQSDNGDELPDGTYYFVIERENGETKTGWIYINRAQ